MHSETLLSVILQYMNCGWGLLVKVIQLQL